MRVWICALGVAQLLLMLVLALSGCGDSSPASNGVASETPAEILAASRAAVARAATVHVAGSIVSAGTPISLDMELIAGKGGVGRVALDGYSVRLIAVDKGAYLNGSAGFFRHILPPASAAAAARLGGRWLKTPARRGNFSWIASLTSLRGLTDAALAAHGRLRRGTPARIDGQPAIALSDPDSAGRLYVASTGNPYPLELQTSTGGKLSFRAWNQPVSLAPPPGAVNISQLQGAR
jgi:hypothetical protein